MVDEQRLMDTLRNTSALLLAIRKFIATSGNIDTMREIDSLLAVAQSETNRQLEAATPSNSQVEKT
jgi:hypothetical protein